ncbi:MAG: 3'(2'),5'-bisphosphate nucleotidase CysQ [Rhodospirillaceae bacterium]
MTTLPDLAQLAEALTSTVRAAGAVIMDIYHSDFDVEHKGDNSPVTAADAAGEKIILADLARLTPDIPVVAEEEAAAGRIPEVGSVFWLVDPLDGTKEFIKRNGEFTVNIGLVADGRPVLGLVYVPVQDVLFVGYGPGTAFREQGNAPREAISCRRPPAAGLTVLASRSHANSEALQGYLGDKTVAEVINAGSSLKFCRVAEGVADLYPRFGPTCEWDTCAAHAVLDAAGGSVTTTDGKPFLYGKTPTFLNPNFVAHGKAA